MSLRVLVVHNFYRSENASGENLSVLDEIEGLRSRGWDVELIAADSDAIGTGAIPMRELPVRPIYSHRSVQRVRDALRRFRPHVALVENLFPLHSPWVIKVLRSAGVPVAAGVRSYRMNCVRSTMYRDGADCRACIGSRLNAPAVVHGCYQDSPLRSIPMAASLLVHRSTFRQVDAFLAVSDFVRDHLIESGFDAGRIVVRPNFVPDPGEPTDAAGDGFLFAGRLTEDKGVGEMIEAWIASGVWETSTLRVAGSGPLESVVRSAGHGVEALGLVPHDEALELARSSAVVVVPSLWPEPFGRGAIEAASLGRAALVTATGGIADLVVDGETGWVADRSVAGLIDGFRRANEPADQVAFGAAARRRYLDRYTRDVSLGILEDTLRRIAERGIGLDET